MAFEEFKKGLQRGGVASLKFSSGSAHMVSISKEADRLLGCPRRISYLYDSETGRIAIRGGDNESYPVFRRPEGGGPVAGCRAFVKTYGLHGRRYLGVMEGDLLVFTEDNGLSK